MSASATKGTRGQGERRKTPRAEAAASTPEAPRESPKGTETPEEREALAWWWGRAARGLLRQANDRETEQLETLEAIRLRELALAGAPDDAAPMQIECLRRELAVFRKIAATREAESKEMRELAAFASGCGAAYAPL